MAGPCIRGALQHGYCALHETRFQYPAEHARQDIDASLPSLQRRLRSPSARAQCPVGSMVLGRRAETDGGTTCLRSSNCFPAISGLRVDNPVILPPGRARLPANPDPTGSSSNVIIIGIVEVASLTGRVTVGPAVTMAST